MIDKISSLENPVIKHIVKIINSKSFRKEEKEFVIEGARLCEDAAKSRVKIKKFLYTEKALDKYKDTVEILLRVCEKSFVVSDAIVKKISDTESSQGLLCLCSMLDKQLCIDKINNIDKFVMFENIQDPLNLGTMLRTAEALGIKGIVLTQDCCDIYNPKVLRGSMGAVFRSPIHMTSDLKKLIVKFNQNGIKTYATILDEKAIPINKVSFSHACAVVVGNEGNGIKKETIDLCAGKITIPMSGEAESLNVAVATSIIMWELIRGG